MQPLKDRLAASHDEATLAKAPRVASRDFRNATEASEKEFSLGGVVLRTRLCDCAHFLNGKASSGSGGELSASPQLQAC